MSAKSLEDKWKRKGVRLRIEDYSKGSSKGSGSRRAKIAILEVEEKNKGIGTNVMKDITKWADKNNITLTLTPDELKGTSSRSRLKKFYKRFGFVENKGRNKDFSIFESMFREPKKLETKITGYKKSNDFYSFVLDVQEEYGFLDYLK